MPAGPAPTPPLMRLRVMVTLWLLPPTARAPALQPEIWLSEMVNATWELNAQTPHASVPPLETVLRAMVETPTLLSWWIPPLQRVTVLSVMFTTPLLFVQTALA